MYLENGQIPATGQRYAPPFNFILKGMLTLTGISTLTMTMTMTMRAISDFDMLDLLDFENVAHGALWS